MAVISKRFGFWIVLLASVTAFGTDVQPANVLVGDITFVRPTDWRWEAPSDGSRADSRFVISTTADKRVTDCRFHFAKDNHEATKGIWIQQFSRNGNRPSEVAEEKVKTAHGTIRFISMNGEYQLTPKHATRSNSRLIGAVLPSGEKFVRARVVGPRAEVEKATAAFKKMIIDAFEQRSE